MMMILAQQFGIGRVLAPVAKEEFITLLDRIVLSAYSGEANTCCCGCAGEHRYQLGLEEIAGNSRGYSVDSEDVSDRAINTRVNKISRAIYELGFENLSLANIRRATEELEIKTIQVGDDHICFDSGTRWTIAYFLPKKYLPLIKN